MNMYKLGKLKILLFILLIVVIGLGTRSSYSVNAKVTVTADKAERTGYIYTGDSRIRRLNLTIGMKKMNRNWVYCKSGMGYSWFVNNSLPEINKTMNGHKDIDKWVIISGWGVNDLGDINAYMSKYRELLYNQWNKCELYLMSVNPVGSTLSAKYSRIGSFNSYLKAFVNNNKEKSDYRISYIDTNAVMRQKGYSTIDGLHYSETTNKLIYNVIRTKLDNDHAALNYTKLKLNCNSIREIEVRDINRMVKWRSSDNSVVSIEKTFGLNNYRSTIKAKAPGNAVITADCGNKKISCRISVKDKKILVAYFSYSGEVEKAAEYIHEYEGGDLYEIDTVKAYSNYKNKFNKEVSDELSGDLRPLLADMINDITKYDTVYLGFPVWNGYAPRPICTFAESYDWTGKSIVPFSTSDKNVFEESLKEVKGLMPGALFKSGFDYNID